MRRLSRTILIVAILATTSLFAPAVAAHGQNWSITQGAVTCGRSGSEVTVLTENPYIFSDTHYAWWAWGVYSYYDGWLGWTQTNGQYWSWSPTDGTNVMWNYGAGQYAQFSGATYFLSSPFTDYLYLYNYVLWQDGHVSTWWADGVIC